MGCSKCGKAIPVKNADDNWEYYCPVCGLGEAFKGIRGSSRPGGSEVKLGEPIPRDVYKGM